MIKGLEMGQQTDMGDTLVYLQIPPRYAGEVDDDGVRNAVAAVARLVPVAEGTSFSVPFRLSIVLVDDDTMRQLNRDYRGVDSSTDVLSFGSAGDEFQSVDEEEGSYLGDVVISFPQAKAQAERAGHALMGEISLLVVHGVLHLLGYDHADGEQKALMWLQQAQVMRDLRLEGVLPTEDD
jgi:probable rRNA maturation factor